jgi:hypothetical protein
MALYVKAVTVQASWDFIPDLTCRSCAFVQRGSRLLILTRMQ